MVEYGELSLGIFARIKAFCLFQLSVCLLPSDIRVRCKGGELTKPVRVSSSDIKILLESEFWGLHTLPGDQKEFLMPSEPLSSLPD